MVELTFDEFEGLIENSVVAINQSDEYCGNLAKVLVETGLRIGEVLELSRWSYDTGTLWSVQLEKGEAVRSIDSSQLPSLFMMALEGTFDASFYNYKAVNYTFTKHMPFFLCNGDQRRTVAHIFRYYFVQKLKNEGYSVQEIQAILMHKSLSSTALYANDTIWAAI